MILVLWAGALLGVIAAGVAFGLRTDLTSVINTGARLQAELLAESAINRALLELQHPDRADGWQVNGRVYDMPFEGGRIRASIHAETGKIDINAAPERLIEGLVDAAREGLDGPRANTAALTAAILDWRDEDSRPRRSGAEDPAYSAAGFGRGAGDRAFLSIDELGQVLGMSEELFERLRPAVTIYTGAPTIDPMTAPKLALLAVPGLEPGNIDAFLSERDRQLDGGGASRARNTEELLRILTRSGRHLALSKAGVFTILAEGRTSDGVTALRQAVVRVDRDKARPHRFLAWMDTPVRVGSGLRY